MCNSLKGEKYKTEDMKMNVSKKIIALLMAMLMAFSCMAVSVSANDTEGEGTGTTETTTPEIVVAKPECEFDEVNRTVTVKPIEDIEANGTTYAVNIQVEPNVPYITQEDGSNVYYNLEFGTKYVFKAFVATSTSEEDTYYSEGVEVSVKKEMTAPAAPVPYDITSKSIKITAVKGYLYSVAKADDSSVVYDWTASKADAIEYDGLDEKTSYVISVKVPENDSYYESKATSITVKTKLAAKEGTPSITLVDKTDSSITVTKLEDIEYSLDGKVWQKSNIFSGLKSNTQYSIVARYTFDASKQDPSAVSEALVVKTNAKANYEAKEKNIKFTAAEGQYANGNITFTVAGDGPANMSEAIYGDTRIVPVSYTVVFGDTTIKEATPWTNAKLSQSGSFTAPDYAEKVVTVKVTFDIEEYKGAEWVNAGSVTKSYDITIGRTGDTGTKVLEFFEGILNFLLNTVPAFFTEALKSDVWGRLLEVIGNIGK